MIRPLDKCLIDAACRYYAVEVDFFRVKKKDGFTVRRRVLFWLLVNDASMDYSAIAREFGYSRVSMSDGVRTLDFQRGMMSAIARDIENIRKLASDEPGKGQTILDQR